MDHAVSVTLNTENSFKTLEDLTYYDEKKKYKISSTHCLC